MKTRGGYSSEQLRNESLKETLPELGKLQAEVYNAIRAAGRTTTEEIATVLGKYVHSITARVHELRDMGYVEVAGSMLSSKTNRKVSLWTVTKKQLTLF
ncbi:MAG: hypothetical protein IPM96_16015 [Ignavibacteria bacterium]|nr:hypothetical protein [Ignavibacteria bacterium]